MTPVQKVNQWLKENDARTLLLLQRGNLVRVTLIDEHSNKRTRATRGAPRTEQDPNGVSVAYLKAIEAIKEAT